MDVQVECAPGQIPRVVDGVVVDPCGCCAIGEDLAFGFCNGLHAGGTASPGVSCEEEIVYDAAPPCTHHVDSNGCEYVSCTGTCLGAPDGWYADESQADADTSPDQTPSDTGPSPDQTPGDTQAE